MIILENRDFILDQNPIYILDYTIPEWSPFFKTLREGKHDEALRILEFFQDQNKEKKPQKHYIRLRTRECHRIGSRFKFYSPNQVWKKTEFFDVVDRAVAKRERQKACVDPPRLYGECRRLENNLWTKWKEELLKDPFLIIPKSGFVYTGEVKRMIINVIGTVSTLKKL